MKGSERNQPCPCNSGKKYKRCCGEKGKPSVPQEVMDYFITMPKEPFEKGGFLTGRGFIDKVFKGERFRAVGGTLYRRPLEETFHLFLLRRLIDIVGADWLNDQVALPKDQQHPMFRWFEEMRIAIDENSGKSANGVFGLNMSGNMRALLAIAYDFYSLQHCQARILPKLLDRLKDKRQFQGARYEIAVGGLAVRSGFVIDWMNDKGKHCEFIGTHKITGDRAAFESKSHHRDGVLGFSGTQAFDPELARIKVVDHIKEALEQGPKDIPLIIFDDLNLPITLDKKSEEKSWFKQVEAQLKPYEFSFKGTQYGALVLTNFSWHFEATAPTGQNETMAYFHTGGQFSLKPETIIQYLDLAAKQYGFVPAKHEEFESIKNAQATKTAI